MHSTQLGFTAPKDELQNHRDVIIPISIWECPSQLVPSMLSSASSKSVGSSSDLLSRTFFLLAVGNHKGGSNGSAAGVEISTQQDS